MTFHLLVRADAYSEIGMGHVVRCLALATYLQQQEGKVTFVISQVSQSVLGLIQQQGCEVEVMDADAAVGSAEDAHQLIQLFKDKQAELVLVDGYQFNEAYLESLQAANIPIAFMDDYHHLKNYPVNLLINQNIYAPTMHYACPETTIQLVGASYVLLRPEFVEHRTRSRTLSPKGQRILISLGGSDPFNQTTKVLEALKDCDLDLELKVVLGASNPFQAEIKAILELYPFANQLLINANALEMLQAMYWCDVAICASGGTCWELAFTGTPALIVIMAQNQEQIALTLAEQGLIENLGWYNSVTTAQIAEQTQKLLFDYSLRQQFSSGGQKLIDGRGGERILEAMVKKLRDDYT